VHYMLLPLDQHFDRGFGAVADAFKDSADSLSGEGKPVFTLNAHLPISFLYRHAIELYFKSAIIIFHRKFDLPFGDVPSSGEPHLPVGRKWKLMYNVHQIQPLYEYFQVLFADHSAFLAENTNTNWEFPEELGSWIKEIEATDSSSTFFRYPITKHGEKDKEKSLMRQDDHARMLGTIGERTSPLKAFLVLNQDDEVVSSFSHDDAFANTTVTTLQKVAETLHNCHAALVGELTRGW